MSEIAELRQALIDLVVIYERPREGWSVDEVLRLKEIRALARRGFAPRLQKIRNALVGKMLDNIRANVSPKNREPLLSRAKQRRPKKRRASRSGGGE